MKRSWFGLLLLAVLLGAGLLSTRAMERIHRPIEADLTQAAAQAQLGNWEEAGRLVRRAEQAWRESEKLRACLADHNPVEEIDGAFQALTVYCAAREQTAFAAASRRLARQVAAVGQAHSVVLENLL